MRDGAASSTSRTWARSRPAARGAEALLQRLLSNDVAKLAVGGAQYACCCREDGGVLDDLFTYRLGADRYLTVTNAANHDKDLAWFRQHAGGFDVEVERRRRPATRCSPCRARRRARSSRRIWPTRRCPTASPPPRACCAAARARLRHRLHGRGRRRAAARPGRRAARSGTSSCAAARRPIGLGARDTLRLEVCYHLYGNDLMEARGPIEAGLGWACKEDTGFIGSEAVARRPRRPARPRSSSPFTLTGPGIARQGNPVVGGGEVTQRHAVAVASTSASAWPTCRRRARAGHRLEIDVRGKTRAAVVAKQAPLHARRLHEWPTPATPTTCSTTPSTTGPASTATSPRSASPGSPRTRSARSCSSTRPRSARRSRKDESYAEVESVKAVSDVIAPLSGEIVEVNAALGDTPESDQRRPLRRGLDGQGQALRPERDGRPARRRRLRGDALASLLRRTPLTPYTAVTDADLEAMLAAIGVGSARGAVRSPDPGRRAARPPARPARRACPSRTSTRTCASSPPRNTSRRGRDHVPRRRDVRPLRPGGHRHAAWGARSS